MSWKERLFTKKETQQHPQDAVVVFGVWQEKKADQDKNRIEPNLVTHEDGATYLNLYVTKNIVPTPEELIAGTPIKRGSQEISIRLPGWIHKPRHPNFKLLKELGAVLQPPIILNPTTEGITQFLSQIFISTSKENHIQRSTINIELLESLHDPSTLEYILQHSNSPEQGLSECQLELPTKKIHLNSGDFDTRERIALIALALLESNQSGPVSKFVSFVYNNDLSSPESSSKANKNPIHHLVKKATKLNKEISDTAAQVEKDKKAGKMPDLEKMGLNRAVVNVPAQAVFSTIDGYDLNRNRFSPEAEELFLKARGLLNFQKFQVDTTVEPNSHLALKTPEAQKAQAQKHLTEQFRQELQLAREERVKNDIETNWELLTTSLCRFHIENITHNQVQELIASLDVIFNQELEQLTHEQITLILALELVITTTPPQDISQTKLTKESFILKLAEELHSYGLYFWNSALPSSHPAAILHGAIINGQFDPCPIHTIPQLQALQVSVNAASVVPAMPVAAPSMIGSISAFSSFAEGVGSIGALGQGIPLFAQAFAFGGAGMGAVFSGGERKANVESSGSVTKPKNSETPRKVSKPRVIFQSSGGGNGGEKKSAPPAKPKPKKRTESTSSPKKTEKPKVTQVPSSRSKPREVPIFTARRTPEPKVTRPVIKEKKVAPPIAKKPKVERVPRLILQPRIVSRPGNERRVNASSSEQHSRTERVVATPQYQTRSRVISDVSASTSFSKRLEQAFQTRTSRKVIATPVESKATVAQSEHSHTVHRTTKQRTQQRRVDTAQSQHRVQSQGEKVFKIITAPAHQEAQTKPASTTHTKKEVRKSPVQTKASIRKPQPTSEVREQVQKKQVKEIKAIQEQPVPAEATETTIETTGENLATVTAALVGGALFETAKRVIPSQTQEVVRPTVSITEFMGDLPTSDIDTDAINARIARKKNRELNPGRGGKRKNANKKKVSSKNLPKIATQKTDRVLTATMRSLPTNAMIDVSDSFNTAREVKMWAQEAFAYPKLMERYYATAV